MFIVQSYELQFPGLFLAAPISDMKKEAGSSKTLSLLFTSVNRSHIKYYLSWQGKVLSPEHPLSPATASIAEQSSGLGPAWSLSQVGSGRWWPVGFAHIFRKEVANPMEMLLYIALKFIFSKAATSHRPCLRDPLAGHGVGILEKSHCLLFPERALGLQTLPLIFPVTNLKSFGVLQIWQEHPHTSLRKWRC